MIAFHTLSCKRITELLKAEAEQPFQSPAVEKSMNLNTKVMGQLEDAQLSNANMTATMIVLVLCSLASPSLSGHWPTFFPCW